MILETALMCLALNVYFEARSEPLIGQQAVAQVTMTRAKQSQDNVCKEVFRPYQFSWANKLSEEEKKDPFRIVIKRIKKQNMSEWLTSVNVARQALQGILSAQFKGITHFYNPDLADPSWKNDYVYVAKIGQHIFMRAKQPILIQT